MALEGGEGQASRPGRFLPQGKTRYPLYRSLGGPQGRSGQVQNISPPPGYDPRTVQPVAQSLYRLRYPANKGKVQSDTKKRELLKNPTKIEEKKNYWQKLNHYNLPFLRDSNPNYQCLKITSFRWCAPPRMRSFTAITHFKSRILQSMQHTQSDTKERGLLKCVVAVKECIRGGGRRLQDVIFKHW